MKYSVQNFSISLKRIIIAGNAKKSTKVFVMRTVHNYMLGSRVVQLCLGLSWAGGARLGILWQREMWRLGEEHLHPFFMVVEAFASKLTVVVLLGRDPISNNQITTADV